MELPAVTQLLPRAQAQLPPHRIRQSRQRPSVDHPVGIQTVLCDIQHPFRPARLHVGYKNSVLIGELVGLIGPTCNGFSNLLFHGSASFLVYAKLS